MVFNEITGESWFFAKDVCDCLGIGNPSQAISNLLSDEKSSLVLTEGTSPKGGNPTFSIVSESGLYTLINQTFFVEVKACFGLVGLRLNCSFIKSVL